MSTREPISKRTAKSGKVTYTFQITVGTRADGSRIRQRHTFPTLREARTEYRRLAGRAVDGTAVARSAATVESYLTEWLDSRRVRANTLDGYRAALKPVIDHLGGVKLQDLDVPHLDELVRLRLTGQTSVQRSPRGRRGSEVLAHLRAHPDGVRYGELRATFGEPGIKALDRLVAAGEVLRPTRGVYTATTPADPEVPSMSGGVSARTVCTMLTVLSSALTAAVKRGLVARNVAALVDRPSVEHREMSAWEPEQAQAFRRHVSGDRLYACWLLTLYGLRRSEVLGLTWDRVDFDAGTVTVSQGRVIVRGEGTAVGDPKSARSRRTLPMPPEVVAALRALHRVQAAERLALGPGYPDTDLVAVSVDGTPLRPETYSKMFRRRCEAAGVPVIRLHDARHTAASTMLAAGVPVLVVAKWLGHDPAMTLRVYGHAHDDALKSAGASLFGTDG
ncbi:tyrosine-type recombinase/integrase [Rhodococcus aetherivorans]|uniref:tyrosine-type recombinase/integrase n=1 Tax=Rhodococcus aetherivorans TaxID=191292 RepID=UPI001E42F426|nr:site-specific integrase [Rhodococcus aetherivorans]UGQ43394.1 site-specific integrase [Rhodococcus aetherivorans]